MFKSMIGRPGFAARKSLSLLSLLSVLWLQCAYGPSAQARGRRPPQAQASPQQQSAGAQNTPDVTTLEFGKPVERELAGQQEHGYQLTLAAGQYASVVIEQRGIDVIVQLLGTDGKSIAHFDIEITNLGAERIEVVAEATGNYRLLVKAKYQRLPAGRYETRLIEVRDATETDRWLFEARRLHTESLRLFNAGKHREALPLAEKAIGLQERVRGAEHPDLVYPLLDLAFTNYFTGDYARGESLSLRALMIAEKALGPEPVLVALALHRLALFYRVRGDDARAESSLQRAIAIKDKALGADHPSVTQSLGELALLYSRKGDFLRAEPLLQHVLTMQEKVLGEEDNYFAITLNNLAGLSREMGDYAKAEPLYQRALAIREKTNHPSLPAALNNLANLYRDMGDYDRAELLYLRSLSIKEKSAPNHPDVADTRGNIAFLYYARGDYAKAKTLYVNALATLEKALGPNYPTVGMHLSRLANIYSATGEYAKAEPLYYRALSIFEAAYGPDYYYRADTLLELARMLAAQGKLAQAIPFQARAHNVIAHNLHLNLATGSERQKLAYLARLGEEMNQAIALHLGFATDDPTASELAVTTILQRKGRVQDALSDSLASLRSRSSAEDQALLDQLNETTSQLARLALNGPRGTALAEHQKQIKALEERREKLESDISRRSAGFYQQSQPVTLAAIRSLIPDDAALIELAVYRPVAAKTSNAQAYGESRYVAYVFRNQGEVRWTDLGPVREVDGAIGRWRQALGNPGSKDVQQLARAVDEKLMRPVRALIGGATHLLVSPDGQLNLIPFEALVDEREDYLVERYTFTYLTSGRDLLRMQVARESRGKSTVIANPSFDRSVTEQIAKVSAIRKPSVRGGRRRSVTAARNLSEVYFAPLGGTALEAGPIRKLLEANLLTQAGATESALKEVTAPRVLHVATHGFFLQDAKTTVAGGPQVAAHAAGIENPLLRSGLALAGANVRGGVGDDGILTALEASGLNLWGTKLVVLSACDTGLGEVRNGEGVYGLRRAFVLAGAESLVMSLWPVSDYPTRRLMTSYYENLVKQKMGRGAALRQVQLKMIEEQRHPFYWANFIQSGEWANLDGERMKNLN